MWKKIVCLSCILIMICVGVGYNSLNTSQIISGNANTVILDGEKREFSTFGVEDFTCTGLAWDSIMNSIWIGDYCAKSANNTPSQRVIQINKELTEVISIIDLSNMLNTNDNLQGVAYDDYNDSLWLAVGDSCKNISKDGKLIFAFDLGKYKKYKSNGICVDGDTLWVLCYSKYLLHYDKSGNLIKEYSFNFKDQDMLFNSGDELIATVGADYNGENNYVVTFNKNTGETDVKYQIHGAYAVEGISIVDGKLYILNDGLYHDAKIRESYFAIYDLRRQQ